MTGATLTRSNPQASACQGKHAFDSYRLASEIGNRKERRSDKSLKPYRCAYCLKFHLGHVKKLPPKAPPKAKKAGRAPRRLEVEEA